MRKRAAGLRNRLMYRPRDDREDNEACWWTPDRDRFSGCTTALCVLVQDSVMLSAAMGKPAECGHCPLDCASFFLMKLRNCRLRDAERASLGGRWHCSAKRENAGNGFCACSRQEKPVAALAFFSSLSWRVRPHCLCPYLPRPAGC